MLRGADAAPCTIHSFTPSAPCLSSNPPALPQVCSLEGQLGITQDELTQKDAHLELLRQACRTSVVH